MKWYNDKFLVGIVVSGFLTMFLGTLWFTMVMTGHGSDVDGFKDLTIGSGSSFGTLLAVKSVLHYGKDK